MKKMNFEELKMMAEEAKKSMTEELKTIREDQERLRKLLLVMDALDELLEENADFREQFEGKLAELIHKEKVAIQDKS